MPLLNKEVKLETYFVGGKLSFLYEKYGSEAFKNMISVKSSSNYDNTIPINAVDPTINNYWISQNYNNSWYEIRFPHPFYISNYLYMTHNYVSGYSHNKNWLLEGTNTLKDDACWTLIDIRKDNYDLNGNSKYKIYKCLYPGTYQRVRIRIIGLTHQNTYNLVIQQIDFFEIKSANKITNLRITIISNSRTFVSVLFLLNK